MCYHPSDCVNPAEFALSAIFRVNFLALILFWYIFSREMWKLHSFDYLGIRLAASYSDRSRED